MLVGTLSALLTRSILFSDLLVASLDSVRLSRELLHKSFFLFQVGDQGVLLLFELAGDTVFLLQSLLDILDPHGHAVAFLFAKEWLGSDGPD